MAASVSGTTYRHEPATTPLHRGIAYHARQVQRCIHCRCMPTDTLVSTCIRACARLAYTGCPRHYEHVRDNKNLFNDINGRIILPTRLRWIWSKYVEYYAFQFVIVRMLMEDVLRLEYYQKYY